MYPNYPYGGAYVISADLVNSLVRLALHVPYFQTEDVYIGMLLYTIGVALTHNVAYSMTKLVLQPTRVRHQLLCDFTKYFTMAVRNTSNPVDTYDRLWTFWNDFDRAQCR